MSAYIFPRLTIGGSHVRRKEMGTAAVDHLEKSVVYKHRMDPGAGRAGQPVPRERLEHIRAGILDISSRVYGYPSNMPSNRVGGWDADVGLWLVEQAAIPLSEARSAEVWSFLCLCVLPDVVAWRWRMDPKLMMSDLEGKQLARFHGGARNTFQRLWLRTHVLLNPEDTDPVRLIRRMPEDALVQVFERPHLSASPVVARTIVEVGVEMHDCVPSSEREDMHRQAVKLLRARAAVRVLEILSPEALRAVVIKAYHDAAGRPLRAPAVESVMLSDKSSKPDDDKHIHQRDKTHASRHLDKRRLEILRTNLKKMIGSPIVPPGFIDKVRDEIRTIESRLEKQGRHSLPQPKEKGFSAKDKKQLMVLLQALTDLTGDPNVSTENIRELQGKIDDLLARKG